AWATTRRTVPLTASSARSRSRPKVPDTRSLLARDTTPYRATTEQLAELSAEKEKTQPLKLGFARRSAGLFRVDVEQHEREQHQRFNKSQADKQRQLDSRPRSRIPGQSFRNGSCYPALSESGQAGSQTHAKADADGNGPWSCRGCSPRALGICR